MTQTLAGIMARTVPTAAGCAEWQGARGLRGYGRISFEGRNRQVTRVIWTLLHGPIPAGRCVLHRCDNPPCCNPAHLWLGTKADNTRDMIAKGRATMIGNGRFGEAHPLAKLTEADVREARRLRAAGASFASLGRRYRVSRMTITDAIRGAHWPHVAEAVA